MARSTRLFSATLVTLALSAAPSAAHAWSFRHALHLHPTVTQVKDLRITVELYNKSGLVQQVKVGNTVYTLMPNDRLGIKAAEGTEVIAVNKGFKHREGDKLCAFTRDMNLETVVID